MNQRTDPHLVRQHRKLFILSAAFVLSHSVQFLLLFLLWVCGPQASDNLKHKTEEWKNTSQYLLPVRRKTPEGCEERRQNIKAKVTKKYRLKAYKYGLEETS